MFPRVAVVGIVWRRVLITIDLERARGGESILDKSHLATARKFTTIKILEMIINTTLMIRMNLLRASGWPGELYTWKDVRLYGASQTSNIMLDR